MPVLVGALVYYVAVFGFAFAMGVARTLVVAPRLGPTAAVLLEIPIVLGVSWLVARRILRGAHFTRWQCAALGAIAFALTMASGVALAQAIWDQSSTLWLMSLTTPLGLVGLTGQVLFGLIPIFEGHRQSRNRPNRAGWRDRLQRSG